MKTVLVGASLGLDFSKVSWEVLVPLICNDVFENVPTMFQGIHDEIESSNE